MKRLIWKNDKPATEKQKRYAADLLISIKGRVDPSGVARSVNEHYNAVFWERAALPDDLTATEASKLIDEMLSYRYTSCNKLPSNLCEAIIKRHDGGPVSSGYQAIMYTSVFAKACEHIETFLREQGAIE